MYWCIYRTTNKVNGKTYIGQHKVKSILKEDGYMGSGVMIMRAIKKYGKENFEKTYITIAISQSEANVLEQFYIDEERAKGKAEYNIADGGKGSKGHHWKPSKEWIRKNADSHRGHIVSEETRRKISEKHKGRVFSEEHKKKLSEARKGKPSYWRGKNLTDEAKHKISESRKGMPAWNKGKKGAQEAWNKGMHWYNNGIENVMSSVCPEGYVLGFIKGGNKEDK